MSCVAVQTAKPAARDWDRANPSKLSASCPAS